MFKRSEVALAVRVVVRGESVEGFHLLTDRRLIFQGQGLDAGCLKHTASYARSPAAKVVKSSYFVGPVCGDAVQGFPVIEICEVALGAVPPGEIFRRLASS